jgi:hypothetical protein
VDDDQARTVQEIDDKIAADRQLYLTAYFQGNDGLAEFYVLEVERLQNLKNIVQRRESARRKP